MASVGILFLLSFFAPSLYWQILLKKSSVYISLINLLALSFVSVIAIFNKSIVARFYLAGTLVLALNVSLFYLITVTQLPIALFTEYNILVASFLKLIILSLGLGYKGTILMAEVTVKELKKRNDERYQQVLRIISHDISVSLNVISVATKRLLLISKKENFHQLGEQIENATGDIDEVLNHVILEKELSRGLDEVRLGQVSLKKCLNDTLFNYQDQLLERNLVVDTKISDSFSVIAENYSFKNCILGNIISNAIKFSPSGSTISIYSERVKNNQILLKIKDTGDGLSNDLIQFLNDRTKNFISNTNGKDINVEGLKLIKHYMNLYNANLKTYNENGAVYELTFQEAKL